MDDLLKGLAAGVAALIAVHGSLERRVQADATRQARAAFAGPGPVSVRVAPEGLFGVFGGDFRAITVQGAHLSVNSLPFLLTPGAGADGRIHHLQLRLRDFTLSGLPVARFDADVPGIRFDIGLTLRRKEVVLSRAGSGSAEAHITPEGLRDFILGKYKQTLSDVLIWTQNRKLFIQGQVRLFGAPTPFTASCALAPRDGRYVDLTQVMVWMGSARLSARNADAITAQFNPVLDIVSDLGLGGYLTLSGVEIGDGFVTLRGQATLPTAALPTGKL